MQTRRTKLKEKFVKLNQKDGKLAKFFEINNKVHIMKTRKPIKYNVSGNTKQFMNSPIRGRLPSPSGVVWTVQMYETYLSKWTAVQWTALLFPKC